MAGSALFGRERHQPLLAGQRVEKVPRPAGEELVLLRVGGQQRGADLVHDVIQRILVHLGEQVERGTGTRRTGAPGRRTSERAPGALMYVLNFSACPLLS